MNKVNGMMMELARYEECLREDEKSENTISKYVRDVKRFIEFVGREKVESDDVGEDCFGGSRSIGEEGFGVGQSRVEDFGVSKSLVLRWKGSLMGYAGSSVNSMLVAVNGFLEWVGRADCKVKLLKLQRDVFSKPEKELTQSEYERLLATANLKDHKKLYLIIQTICGTGIRISELKYITIEGVKIRRITVSSKGKSRPVFLPINLCKQLVAYCRAEKIVSGKVFLSKSGREMNRCNIWQMMKNLCKKAKVAKAKVFPHNLRHLFARTFYKIEKNITRLADILGHSSINTTRIYTMETGVEHVKQLDKMHLVSA